MMQMIPKWKITMTRSGAPSVVIFISDHYLSNVLRKLAEIEFDVVPQSVTIAPVTCQPATATES
jgi:hypothetical protein